MIRKIRICSIFHQPGWFKSRPEVFAQFIYVTGILRFRPGVDELIAKRPSLFGAMQQDLQQLELFPIRIS